VERARICLEGSFPLPVKMNRRCVLAFRVLAPVLDTVFGPWTLDPGRQRPIDHSPVSVRWLLNPWAIQIAGI